MNKPIFLGVELAELLNGVRQICREEISELLQKGITQAKHDDEFMDMDQASVFLKKAKQTLYALCSSNSIPHFSKSGQNYFKKQDLIEWIESGRKSKKKEAQPNRLLFTNKHKI
ncbi:helix-turn-helix domain-containing protein [Lacihabitans sp. CS3-21]|uniref:helix-turn-helix domain-containing protein n=1 Tax=Lacihabitans sp. CS3-21 TaxID=2487332 RepID=UPI0020CC216F|nr:helix-turn-helix domain-containing protein [Lacihabitans sp. CS3-21]MCP9747816.1 DNA-binding protein [Lacihabitans sp. CS3-21]